MRMIKNTIRTIVLLAVFVAGAAFSDAINLDFLSVEKATYDIEILQEQISDISEMASIEYKYMGDAEYDGGAKKFFNKDIPFTSKSMQVRYEGIVKLGANLSELKVEEDAETGKVIITVPHSKILSHEIDNDTWEIVDVQNGLFNKVTLEDNNEFVKEQKKKVAKEIKDGNLLQQADEKTVQQLKNFLAMSYADLDVEIKLAE